jgi:CRP/FNR family transcriptional regulator, cyclic AMP receptor protein
MQTSETESVAGFLGGLRDDELVTVLGYAQARRYPPYTLAVRSGDRDRSLFIVTAGSFEVLLPTPSGPLRVQVLRPGDLFGELAFFDGLERSADVRALEDAEALLVTPDSFDRLRLAEPRLALSFAMDLGRILSGRLRAMDDRMASHAEAWTE